MASTASWLPFLTEYAPVGAVSGSIDPLGSLRPYEALADLLLPGITTITDRSRYLPMLCAALAVAEKNRDFHIGPTGMAERRASVEPFERLWALACVIVEDKLPAAAAGLRGVTRARAKVASLQSTGQRATPKFELLKYQGRTGGVATYWVTLKSAELISDSGALTAEGKNLAQYFPPIPLGPDELARLSDPKRAHSVSIDLDTLRQWGTQCHLAAARKDEKKEIGKVLILDNRRDAVAAALSRYCSERALPDYWDIATLRRLGKHLEPDERSNSLGLTQVLDAVIALERFHDSILTVFYMTIWWGTVEHERTLADLMNQKFFKDAAERSRKFGSELSELAKAATGTEVGKIISEFATFAAIVAALSEPRSILDKVLQRHASVQSGKLVGGTPKREWYVRIEGSDRIATTPRFERRDRPRIPTGDRLTHPYRLEQFVGMLRETDLLAGSPE